MKNVIYEMYVYYIDNALHKFIYIFFTIFIIYMST